MDLVKDLRRGRKNAKPRKSTLVKRRGDQSSGDRRSEASFINPTSSRTSFDGIEWEVKEKNQGRKNETAIRADAMRRGVFLWVPELARFSFGILDLE